jgi:hypothetical protein
MSMGQSMTPADVAAVVDNNRGGYGFGYPIMPYPMMGMGGGFGNGFGFGGDFLAILLLFALFGGGWGGGFGGFGGFGGAGLGLTDGGLLGYAIGNNATKGDLTGVQTSSKLDSIATQIGAGFANNSTQLCNGFSDVQAAIANGAYNINTGLLTGFANTNLNACQNTNAITNAIDNARFAQQQCCCETKANIADLKYTVATENCADRAALESGVRDIITNQTANTQKILDTLCQDKIDAKNDIIAQLRQELLYSRGQASQVAQTAAIQAGQVAEVDALYNRLVQCPVPSMPVYGMTPIFTCNRNSSCGCNNGSQYILQ